MEFQKRTFFIILILLLVQRNSAQMQNQEIRIASSGKPIPTTPQITSAMPANLGDTRIYFQSQGNSQVCAIGMWALYNNTQFGQGMETTTSVITIRGYDPQSCASYQQYPAFRFVQSVNFLGNPMLNNPGIIIFSQPNFLGASYSINGAPPTTPLVIGGTTGPNAIRLGSFAITGSSTTASENYWRLCADANCISAVCIDLSRQRGYMYLNINVPGDNNVPWPIYVRAISGAPDAGACANDPNPPPYLGARTVFISSNGKPLEVF